MCRSVGDADCPFASAEPAVQTVACAPSAAVVICSDGVWDALSTDKLAVCVRECATAEAAATRIVSKAVKKRGLRDDTSSIVAWLGTPPWVCSSSPQSSRRLFTLPKLLSTSPSRSPESSLSSSPCLSPTSSPEDSSPDHTPEPSFANLDDTLLLCTEGGLSLDSLLIADPDGSQPSSVPSPVRVRADAPQTVLKVGL